MRFAHRLPQLLCLLTALSGCMGWHTPDVSPATLIERDHPATVRVTRQDRSRFVLLKPIVEQDSLRGRRRSRDFAMPLSDVASLSVRKTQVAATTALVVVTAGLLAFVIALSQSDFGY